MIEIKLRWVPHSLDRNQVTLTPKSGLYSKHLADLVLLGRLQPQEMVYCVLLLMEKHHYIYINYYSFMNFHFWVN